LVKNLIFDFDGTIVDTSEGIIKSMHYAFEKLEIKNLPDSRVKEIIGPPLDEMIAMLFDTEDKKLIEKGMFNFRQRYSEEGLEELKLYDSVEDTLSYLHNSNIKLFIVTSKPYKLTKVISENLGIIQYFNDISGSNLYGESKSKGYRIKEIINKHNLDVKETFMVGDRKEDVISANQNSIYTIGMLYGFGKKEDLESAGCKYFCNDFKELKKLIKI
jgi:phosphoglycolate phosphatase